MDNHQAKKNPNIRDIQNAILDAEKKAGVYFKEIQNKN